jgi:hypothetical protein
MDLRGKIPQSQHPKCNANRLTVQTAWHWIGSLNQVVMGRILGKGTLESGASDKILQGFYNIGQWV